jgi:NAD-dependent dihydropyrimidine dehydrogenase PreA subunit
MGQMIYLKNVVTLALDEEKCFGCGTCLLVCPHAVLGRSNGKVSIIERDACMECGACATNCPAEAIRVEAGVGCTAAVINAALGRQNSSCCCVLEPQKGKESSCC